MTYSKTTLYLVLASIVVCVPLWLTEWLPMVDLPQHAAQAAMLRDLVLGTSAHADVLRLNFFTPYLLGTSVLAALMTFLPAAEASRWVVAACMAAMVFATARLLSRGGGDIRLAPLSALGLYGFAFHWGFLNFLVAAPLGVLALSFVLDRDVDVARRHPALASVGLIALFFCHALIAALVIGVHLLRVLLHERRWRSAARCTLPVLPCVAFAVLWVMLTHQAEAQVSSPIVWDFGVHRVLDLPALALGTGSLSTLLIGVFAGGSLLLAGYRPSRGLQRWIPAVVVLGILLFLPNVLFGNAFTYQRFGFLIVPFVLLGLDRFERPADHPLARFQKPAAVAVLLLLCLHLSIVSLNMVGFSKESAGFRAVLAEATPGQRAVQMTFQRRSLFSTAPVYLHFGSWYAAERHGLVDFSFAEFAVAVVRYRENRRPLFPSGFEWNPAAFVELSRGARIKDYRYFFVHSRDDVSGPLFDNILQPPALVAENGPWRLFKLAQDTRAGEP